MQAVSIKNPTLIKTLNWFSDWVFSQDQGVLNNLIKRNEGIDADEACSLEYLHKLQESPDEHSGFPRHAAGFDMNLTLSSDMPDGWDDIGVELDKRMIQTLGVGFNALKMYYPENGYIGWHNNSNCPGHNLVMTYTPPNGSGYFQYQDPLSKEIIKLEDSEGWTAKAGYFGSHREPDKVIWHSARCYAAPRLTISYVIRDEWMWEEMVYDIQSDQ